MFIDSCLKVPIEVDKVIKDFGITNLQSRKTKNTRTGKIVDYAKSNYDWVKSQVDYFNSGFTDQKSWERFTTIVYTWYYNYGFKKYKKVGNGNLGKIQEWAEDAYMCFIQTYKRRIELIKYFQKKTDVVATDRWTKRILKKKSLSSAGEQFAHLFQAKIGSLGSYVIGLRIQKEDTSFLSTDYLMSKNPNSIMNKIC